MSVVKVMILTKNEEALIGPLIDEINLSLQGFERQLFLVDDSSDKTAEIARLKGCEVVSNEGLGLGRAYSRALRKACETPFSYLVVMDGDGQACPQEIPRFMEMAGKHRADLVLGSRFLEKGLVEYSYPPLNRLGVFLLSWFLSFECRMKITDSHGGLRVHSPKCANCLRVRGTHTYVQESIIDARRQGLVVLEVPSRWRKRKEGRSRVVSSVFIYMKKVLPVLIWKARRIYLWSLILVCGGFAWAFAGR